MTLQTGTIHVHPRGFGFLSVPESETTTSLFISPPDLNGWLDGDRVQAQVISSSDGRLSARPIQLLERARAFLFGQLVMHRGQAHLRVDREVSNTDWPLVMAHQSEPFPPEKSYLIARLVDNTLQCERVLAPSADPSLEAIICRYALRSEFSPQLQQQAMQLSLSASESTSFRRDIRSLETITIDAPSTRDLDDAVSVLGSDRDGAMRLLVSIADVSSVVTELGALDMEAKTRSTSVYLPDRVLPMLPPSLSEQSLSLLPGVDRKCITVELRITPEGQVSSIDVYRSLIRSRARLSYEQLGAFLDRGQMDSTTLELREMLTWCRTAFARLCIDRERRGGVQMAREEARIAIDQSTGEATVLAPSSLPSAHLLVERFMVAANEAVARWTRDRGIAVPYRVHPEPLPEAVLQLSEIAQNFGFAPGFGPYLSPLGLSALQRQIQNAPAAPAILSVLAKTLGPAYYCVQPGAHFGLSTDCYLHFTSPLRRYADLLVHRAIGAYLDGQRPTDSRPAALESLCQQLNEQSRRAAKAEAAARRVISARYIASRLGQTFEASIIDVRPFGLQIQLHESLVIGTVSVESLPQGPYRLLPQHGALVSDKRRFGIGMPLCLRAVRADEVVGRIEFELV